jgi:flagellin
MASFSVVNNIASANAQSYLNTTQIGLQRALTRLSSGFRINSSGDDAAGLVTANAYRQEIAIISQGIRNANDGLSDLQIKDGALANVATLLDRLATLATQSASGTTSQQNRTVLQDEFTDVVAEITREISVAGLASNHGFSVFVSNQTGTDGQVTGMITGLTTTTMGLATANMVLSQSSAASAVATIAAAVATLGTSQSKVGALQNRLQFAIGLAQSQKVNMTAAESRIRDANVAEESANMTRFNILTQSGIAALAQANAATSSVLALLR